MKQLGWQQKFQHTHVVKFKNKQHQVITIKIHELIIHYASEC